MDVLEQPLTCRATSSKVLLEPSFSHLKNGLIKTIFHKVVVWRGWPILPEKPVLPSHLQRISLAWPTPTYLAHSLLILLVFRSPHRLGCPSVSPAWDLGLHGLPSQHCFEMAYVFACLPTPCQTQGLQTSCSRIYL